VEVPTEFEGYAPVRLREYDDPWSSDEDPDFRPVRNSLYKRLYLKSEPGRPHKRIKRIEDSQFVIMRDPDLEAFFQEAAYKSLHDDITKI
jgi:hypothetical protein